jgi:DNA polymerase III delta subunit
LKFETNTQYLIAMLSRELSIMFKLKYFSENNMDLKDLGLHPFVLQKSIKKIKNFSLEDLKNKIRDLMLLDYKIKSGRLPDTLALKLFLNSL